MEGNNKDNSRNNEKKNKHVVKRLIAKVGSLKRQIG